MLMYVAHRCAVSSIAGRRRLEIEHLVQSSSIVLPSIWSSYLWNTLGLGFPARTVPSSELHGDPPFTAAGRARPAGAARDYLRAWSAAAESSRRDRVRGMTNECH